MTAEPHRPPPPVPEKWDGLPDHPVWLMANCFPETELGQKAYVTFESDLPELLAGHRGMWAAYRGTVRLGIDGRATRLYDDCVRRGFSPGDFVLCQIEPVDGVEVIGSGGSTEFIED
jgi:hypothetical protein